MTEPTSLPASVDATEALLAAGDYVADRSLATALFLALKLRRPLFLEGEAGVGKTEIAKVLSETLSRDLIRLQCYEGLDVSSAVYEWNYARQMIEIRLAEAAGEAKRDALTKDVFAEEFLIKRPLLQALEAHEGGPPVLLIDELDRTDEPFEAFLLEILSDFQITIPEIGVFSAEEPPVVIITSNRTREIHDALKRRCFYYWVDYPDAERELEILEKKAPEAGEALRRGRRRLHPETARCRPVQAAGRCRDHRLGPGVGATGCRCAGSGHAECDARHPAQISGRYRTHSRQRSHADPGRDQDRSFHQPGAQQLGNGCPVRIRHT